jgi:streptomycin 6-kinase
MPEYIIPVLLKDRAQVACRTGALWLDDLPEALERLRTRWVLFASACLIHGDAHIWNTLLVLDTSPAAVVTAEARFVDPDGLYGEKAIDLAISMREWRDELLQGDPLFNALQRCNLLAELAGGYPEPIWQWGFIERVADGLLDADLGQNHLAQQSLTIAQAWSKR